MYLFKNDEGKTQYLVLSNNTPTFFMNNENNTNDLWEAYRKMHNQISLKENKEDIFSNMPKNIIPPVKLVLSSSPPSNNNNNNKKKYKKSNTQMKRENKIKKMDQKLMTQPGYLEDTKDNMLSRQNCSRVERWKQSPEGQYMKLHCLREYYTTIQEIEKR